MDNIAILLRGHCKRDRPESMVSWDPIHFNFCKHSMKRFLKYIKNPLNKIKYNVDFYCSYASEEGSKGVDQCLKPIKSILEKSGQNANTLAGIDLILNSETVYSKIIISRFDFLIKKPITYWWEKLNANNTEMIFVFNEITPWVQTQDESRRVCDIFHWINNNNNILPKIRQSFKDCAFGPEGHSFHELRRQMDEKNINYGFMKEIERFDSNTCHSYKFSCNPVYALAGRNYFYRQEEKFRHKSLFMRYENG